MIENIANIRRTLSKADDIDWTTGLSAYSLYNITLSKLAAYYGMQFEKTVAAFVALSPNNDYIKNLRSTATLLKGFHLGIRPENLTVTTYNACKYRAWRCLCGEDFLSFTRGKKTRNFYQCIVNPQNQSAVTIDGHMVNIWNDKRQTMVASAVSKFNYDEIAHDFRVVAFREFLLPMQLQAICWFTWKRINKIVYKPQMDFTMIDNHWQMKWEPEEVEPYGI